MINFITILAALSFLNLKCGSVNPSNKRLKERKTNSLLLSPRDQFGCSQPIWIFIMYWWFISKPWRFCWWSPIMFEPQGLLLSLSLDNEKKSCSLNVEISWIIVTCLLTDLSEGLLLKKMRWVIEEGLRSGTVY